MELDDAEQDWANECQYRRDNGMRYDPEQGGWVCRQHRYVCVTRDDGSEITYCENCG